MLPISPTLSSPSAYELVVPLGVRVPEALGGKWSHGPALQLTEHEHPLLLMVYHRTEGQVPGMIVLHDGVVRDLDQLLYDHIQIVEIGAPIAEIDLNLE